MTTIEKKYMGIHPGTARMIEEGAAMIAKIERGGVDLASSQAALWGYAPKAIESKKTNGHIDLAKAQAALFGYQEVVE